jgi:molybdopterin molybdotransferase
MSQSNRKNRDMLGRSNVVSLAEALQLMHNQLPPCPARKTVLALEESLGRICAEDILSPENLPPYPRSTMDGYALNARDTFGASEILPAYLEVKGEVAMGEFPESGPEPGTCYAIATGGILPPGTDAVVMLEHTVAVDAGMIEVVQPVAAGTNVIDVGDDIGKDEILLTAGHRIRPQDIGLLAGVGVKNIEVYSRMRVGIIATGDEIIPYDQKPPPGKIRDINSICLAAQVRSLDGEPSLYGIAADVEDDLSQKMNGAMTDNDIVLLSGSSSVGTRDLGEKVIAQMGPPGIIVHGVAIKPGKPVIIARAGQTMIYGLPGHPVSAAVAFDLFVRPAIFHLSGLVDKDLPKDRIVKARLKRNINSAAGRTDFVRVQLHTDQNHEHEAYPILGKSGALSTMVKAHGYIEIAEKIQGLKEGEIVAVKLFD